MKNHIDHSLKLFFAYPLPEPRREQRKCVPWEGCTPLHPHIGPWTLIQAHEHTHTHMHTQVHVYTHTDPPMHTQERAEKMYTNGKAALPWSSLLGNTFLKGDMRTTCDLEWGWGVIQRLSHQDANSGCDCHFKNIKQTPVQWATLLIIIRLNKM